MNSEYDFSKGERGKFYRPNAEFQLPIYLDKDVMDAVQKRAQKGHVGTSKLVSELLRKDLSLTGAAK